MKKRIMIAAGSLLLAIIIMLLIPVNSGNPDLSSRPSGLPSTGSAAKPSDGSSPAPGPSSTVTRPSVPATFPSNSTAPTTTPTTSQTPTTTPTVPPTTTTVPPTTTTVPPPPGQVRLYSCDAALREVYAQLAVEYYKATGIEVILLAPAEAESCTDALARYMAADMPPTVFCVHEEATLQQYADRLYDFKGTAVAGKLYSADFGMYSEDKLLALPVAVDWFGYIYNTALLSKVSFSRKDFFRSDMSGYHSMARIVKYITSQNSTLGANAFGQPALASAAREDLAYLMSTAFRDPKQLRSYLDLYVGNSGSTTDAMASFQNGKIVFYAGTTASFEKALVLGIDKLELLPAFSDGSDAMHYTCDDFWAVAGTGYAPDIAETVAFLNWMVTKTEKAAAPIDRLGLLSPYKDATVAHNALEKLLRKYMQEEPVRLVWNSNGLAEEDMTAFCAALTAYYQKPGDATWAAVEALLKKENT